MKGVRPEWHCRFVNTKENVELWSLQLCSQDRAWLLHERVAVTTTFEYTRFDTAGAVRHFALRDELQENAAVNRDFRGG
jgi:hypothetical protein